MKAVLAELYRRFDFKLAGMHIHAPQRAHTHALLSHTCAHTQPHTHSLSSLTHSFACTFTHHKRAHTHALLSHTCAHTQPHTLTFFTHLLVCMHFQAPQLCPCTRTSLAHTRARTVAHAHTLSSLTTLAQTLTQLWMVISKYLSHSHCFSSLFINIITTFRKATRGISSDWRDCCNSRWAHVDETFSACKIAMPQQTN